MRTGLLVAAVLASFLSFPARAQIQLDQAQGQSAGDSGDASAPPRPDIPAAKANRSVFLKARVQDLRGYGRLTMPPMPRGDYAFTVEGDKLVIGLPKGIRIAEIGRRPRNALSITWGPNATEVVVVPGAKIRVRRVRRSLVVDLIDPPSQSASASEPPSSHQAPQVSELPAPRGLPAAVPVSPDPEVMVAPTILAQPRPYQNDKAASSVTRPVATAPIGPERPQVADQPSPSTHSLIQSDPPGTVTIGGSETSRLPADPRPVVVRSPPRIEAVVGASAPSILLPVERGIGLAVFRSGSETLFILDAPISFQVFPPSLDPVFARMSSSRMQDLTVLRVPGTSSDFHMSRSARGWIVSAGPPSVPTEGIESRLVETSPNIFSMRFAMSEPSRVVSVMDPETGVTLLVGTQGVPGQALLGERLQTQFVLVPTLQGLVVSPTSDDIRLRREADGFGLSAGPSAGGTIESGVQSGVPGTAPPSHLSRLLDIPTDTVQALYATMAERVLAAAEAPALARSEPRLHVAEAMVALGLGVEAQSVLDVAAAADPPFAERPQVMGLRAVAALLAHRLDQVGPMSNPRLDGTEEVQVWRALIQVERDKVAAGDANSLASGLPLLQAYPQPLRDRFLPEALEAMAIGGQAAAAALTLKGVPEDHRLDLARGMALEMTGHVPEALQAYDEVAGRSDRLPRYKALVRAVELRLRSGEVDVKSAADALDKSLYSWRGTQQELSLRMRIADLRRQAGQWQQALAVLRDGNAAFPEDRAQIDREMAATLIALLTGEGAGRMAPAEFVALYDQNQELIQSMAWDERTGTRFVEQLITLGLQGRAEPIMAGLVARASDDGRRVLLGTRLASLRLTSNDAAGAIAALADTSPPPGLPVDPPLIQVRQLLYARAESERGNKDVALSMLASLSTADADEVRADIYASREDWPHAVEALSSLERRRILTPDLDPDQQALVARLAVAATLSSDATTLGRLMASYGPAMAKGASAGLFRLMTSPPVRGTGDLPRAFQDIQTARQVQGRLAEARTP